MSFIDNLGQSIADFGGALTGKLGWMLDAARSGMVGEAMPMQIKALEQPFETGSSAIMGGLTAGANALNVPGQFVRRAISTPFASFRIAQRDNVLAGNDPSSMQSWQNMFHGETWGEAWDYAKTTSVTQNIFDAASVSTLTPEADRPENYANAFAPTDEELAYRQQHDVFENVVGGGIDFAVNLFLDPLNVIGKASGAIRTGLKYAPVPKGENVAKALETGGKEVVRPTRLGRNVGQRWDRVKEVAKTQDTWGIFAYVDGLKDSTQGMAVASALRKAGQIEDAAEADKQLNLVGRILYGDETARPELAQRNTEIADQMASIRQEITNLERSQFPTTPEGQGILFLDFDAAPPKSYFDDPEVQAVIQTRLDNLKDLDDEVSRITELTKKGEGSLFAAQRERTLNVTRGSVRRGKRDMGYGGFRAVVRDLNETKPGWATHGGIIRRSLWNIPVQVFSVPFRVGEAVTTMAGRGFVDMHDPNAVTEIEHMFQQPVLRGLDDATKRKYLSSFVDASNEPAKMAVINAAESAAFAHIAGKYGLKPEQASTIVNAFRQKRMTFQGRLKMYAGASQGEAYSSAPHPNPPEGMPELRADTYVTDQGEVIRAPLLPEQAANKVSLLDVGLVEHVMKRNSNKFLSLAEWIEDANQSLAGAALGVATRKADALRWGLSEFGYDALGLFNRLWKFGVLTRFGYVFRNLTDEHARSWGRVGSAMATLYVEGIWNVAKNRLPGGMRGQVRRAQQRHWDDYQKREDLETEMDVFDPDGTLQKQAKTALREVQSKVAKTIPRSKVRDADNNLIRVYHGTPRAFDEFSEDYAGSTTDAGFHGPGFYFTPDPAHASRFADIPPRDLSVGKQSNIRPAYLDIQKPWNWDLDKVGTTTIRKMAKELGVPPPAAMPKGGLTMWQLQDAWTVTRGPAGQVNMADFNRVVGKHMTDRGYDGIHRPETMASGEEWIAFRSDQVKNAFEYEADVATMSGLREEMSDATEQFIGKTRELEALNAKIAEAEANPLKVYNIGTTDVDVRGGTVPAPFAATSSRDRSDKYRAMTSSAGMYQEWILGGEKFDIARLSSGGGWEDIAAGMPGHDEAWVENINRIIRVNPLMKRMVDGQSDQTIVAWLKTPEGKKYGKSVAHHGTNPGEWVARLRNHYDHYVPVEWRDFIRKRNVTMDDIEEYKRVHGENLPTVNGPALAYDTGGGPAIRRINRIMNATTRWLGDIPTDRLARHPFYTAVYRRTAKQEADALLSDFSRMKSRDVLDADDIEHIRQKSHSVALKELRRTMFDASAHSNAADMARFISPFMGAWEDTMRRWWSIIEEKPQVLNYFSQAWQMPNKVVMVVDQDGNPVSESRELSDDEFLVMKLPPWMGGKELVKLPGNVVPYVPKSAFNLWLQSDPWFLPGVGPLVQIPVGYFQTKNTTLEKWAKFINPFGPPDDVFDALAPATVKRAAAWLDGPGNKEFGKDVIMIHSAAIYDWEKNGREGPEPTWDDTLKAAEALTGIKMLNNFVSPFPAQFRSPYQFIIDEHRRYQDQARMEDRPMSWADEELVRQHGRESLILVQSLSENAIGAQATSEFQEAYKGDKELLKAFPQFARHLIGNRGDGEFSPSAYAAQLQEALKYGGSDTIRSLEDPVAAWEENQANMGWWDYKQITAGLQVYAHQMGLEDYRDDKNLMWVKRQMVDQLRKDNPAFDRAIEAVSTPDAFEVKYRDLQRMVNSGKFNTKTHPLQTDWPKVQEYIEIRDTFTVMLAQRKYKTMDAEANADLSWTYWQMIKQLKNDDTAFESNWYDSFIENDPYLPREAEEEEAAQ